MRLFFIVATSLLANTVFAQAATDVNCDKCVDTADIALNSISGNRIKAFTVGNSRIKNGSVSMNKLDPDVRQLIFDMAAYIELLQAYIEIDEQTDPSNPTVKVIGANLQILNGAGGTASANGKGNLIVGYNETGGDYFCTDPQYDLPQDCTNGGGTWDQDVRTGSHNVVVGRAHSYTQFGGIVGGFGNILTGNEASVTAGKNNRAHGQTAHVSGGQDNLADANRSVVVGGQYNEATNSFSTVGGGIYNEASGLHGSVSGGRTNTASGSASSVSGGVGNSATSAWATVSGGSSNDATGQSSVVSGGLDNVASGSSSTVGGGITTTIDFANHWGANSEEFAD